MMIVTGLDQVVAEHPVWWRDRVGLLANQASVTRDQRYAWEAWGDFGRLEALFSPQHGMWGEQQANMQESYHVLHPDLDLPVFSLYYRQRRPLPEMLEGLQRFVIDLQDVGTRVYTFAWTMMYCLEACAEMGIPVTVLDRPNPVGGRQIEGPLLQDGYTSFVGRSSIPMRHGLTMGELARFLVDRHAIDVELDVVPLRGWNPESYLWECQRADRWIAPSPNIPMATTALYYVGNVLLEGTNLSEGRGSTRPFELVGAPFIEPRALISLLRTFDLPGVRFLPLRFRPTFDKWAGSICSGVQLRVTDPREFRPYATTVALMASAHALWPDQFAWARPPYEYEYQRLPIEILAGGEELHRAIDGDAIHSPDRLREAVAVDEAAWWAAVGDHLLYARE